MLYPYHALINRKNLVSKRLSISDHTLLILIKQPNINLYFININYIIN